MKNKLLSMIFLATLLATLLTTSACSIFKSSTEKERTPSSSSDTLFSDIINDITARYQTLTADTSQCAIDMQKSYERLFNLVGSSVYFDMDDQNILDKDIQRSFEARLLLKESIRHFEIENEEDKRCFAAIADVSKALRYVEDYMVEMRMSRTQNAPQNYVNMQGEFPYLLVNPQYAREVKSHQDLKSGDVILSRGNAYTSAAIARIGESDYQFSHLSFVYRDPKNENTPYTTEAHIEVGVVTAHFVEHLNEKNSRSVVFRYRGDPQIIHQASEYTFNYVKNKMQSGKNIEYDFAMNYQDDSRIFCSEVLSNGLHHVLPNEDYVPKFKSHFDRGLIPFLNNLGVPVTKENVATTDVFSPGDIQFDPQFDLVMEWRNPLKMQESRFKDFILTKLFEKMSKENYVIDSTIIMDAQAKTSWLLRRIPIVKKLLEKKFPLNMNPTQIKMFVSLDKIGEALYREIESKAQVADHSLTPKEIYNVIDNYLAKNPKEISKYFHRAR